MKNFMYVLMTFFLGITGFSQNLAKSSVDNTTKEKMEFGNFRAMQLPIITTNKSKKMENELPSNNQIFIEQIGNQNTITSNITSKSAKANLHQNGHLNNIDLDITAKSYLGNIDQKGRNNQIFDNVYAPESNISLDLSQNGNNHHFERHGSNSIGNKLKFKIKGNDKSIIVRNFK